MVPIAETVHAETCLIHRDTCHFGHFNTYVGLVTCVLNVMEFIMCTGAVKVTPAHSHVDFDLSQRHGLPLVTIFTDDGCLIDVPQPFLVIPQSSVTNAGGISKLNST